MSTTEEVLRLEEEDKAPKGVCVTNSNIVADENNELQRVVDTACLGCVFAKGELRGSEGTMKFYQDDHGCKIGALEKFAKHGAEIQDAIDGNCNEFHVIKGRVCPYYRMERWLKDMTEEEAITQILTEVKLRCDAVIYFDDSMEPQDIVKTVHAISSCDHRPKKIYVANNSSLRPSRIFYALAQCNMPWYSETVLEEDCTMMRALDLTQPKCTEMFITYFKAGFVPPQDFFSSLNAALYDRLDKFILLKPIDDLNGLVVHRVFQKQAAGNARSSIVEKVEKISKEQKCQHLVRPVTEIVPQLLQS